MFLGGMTSDQPTHTPIIDHVVDVLDMSFGFGISTLIVDPKAPGECDIVTLAEAAEPLRVDTRPDQTVLESHVAASGDIDCVPPSPGDGDMIKDDIVAVVDIDRALSFSTAETLAETHIADNHVVCLGEGDSLTENPDPIARSCLASDRQVTMDGDGRLQ